MRKGAVIIESRDLNVNEIINRHKPFLPDDWDILHINEKRINSINSYNALLTNIKFWESLPFDKVLIFQHDSGLLRNGIEDFMEWDYIGAAWQWQEIGGNGGLSLRTVKAMIDTLKKTTYSIHKHGNEDVYFSNHLLGKLAPRTECEKFSCEAIFTLGTLGYHAINKYLTDSEVKTILNQYETK